MNIRPEKFDQLTNGEIAAWSAIQRGYPIFSSPCFRPEFTEAVAAVRGDVEVAVLKEAGSPVGFFPYQRTPWNAGKPIAGPISDFQALIAPPELPCDPLELVRKCRLSSWTFHHLVPAHASFEPFAWSSADSPYIDLSNGFEDYIARRVNGCRMMSEYGQKKRKLERNVGPVRYVPHVCDRNIVETCIRWKSDQYDRTEADNIFNFPWVVRLLDKILACDQPDFTPVVSVTYAGDQIAAINFGMRSGSVLHPWFPAYNRELSNHSPGYLHWIETMRAAAASGISRIDLVKGEEAYKQRFMNGALRVATGAIDLRPTAAMARRAWRHTRESIKSSPLYTPARVPARVVRRVVSWLELR